MSVVSSRKALEGALEFANQLARIEILTALREPQRRIVSALTQRAETLSEIAELEEFANDTSGEEWGMF